MASRKKVLFARLNSTLFKNLVRFVKKTHFFCIFLVKYLHISKKSITFAPDFKKEITKHQKKETQKETKL